MASMWAVTVLENAVRALENRGNIIIFIIMVIIISICGWPHGKAAPTAHEVCVLKWIAFLRKCHRCSLARNFERKFRPELVTTIHKSTVCCKRRKIR